MALMRWFDQTPSWVEEGHKMVGQRLEYSKARKACWDEECKDPKRVQTMAKDVANLPRTRLSHSQGIAEAFPPPGPPRKPPVRATSSPRPQRWQQQRQQHAPKASNLCGSFKGRLPL